MVMTFWHRRSLAVPVVVVAKDASHKLPDELPSHLAVVTVDEPEQALQTSAQRWAESQDVFTIGLTGSSGKTSTKEMLAQILSVHAPVLATQGNLNNHLGVPLTLWSLTEEHRYAVVEMGMNAPGEISFLASLAQPNLGIVTTVGEAHTEGVGSLEELPVLKGNSATLGCRTHGGLPIGGPLQVRTHRRRHRKTAHSWPCAR